MSEHIDDVSRNFCPPRRYGRGSAFPMLLVTIALALPAFAVGFMWGPAMGAAIGLTAGDQPSGAAADAGDNGTHGPSDIKNDDDKAKPPTNNYKHHDTPEEFS